MKYKSTVVRSGKKICLVLVNPVYKKVTEIIKTPEGKLVKERREKFCKETRVMKWIDREAIVSVEEYITSKGTVAKNRSIVYDKYSNRYYATWHPVSEILEAVEGVKEDMVGFRAGGARGAGEYERIKSRWDR